MDQSSAASPPAAEVSGVPFRAAVWVWLRIGFLSFGGPAGQIALMHRILVVERRWIDEARFLHALNFCMLLPGPEAQQLATYLGWSLHRVVGGLVAGVLFILPGAAVILALSFIYVLHRDVPLIDGLFFGIRAAVLAIIVDAILRIGRRALDTGEKIAVAAAAFIALFVFDLPFPLVILCAGLLGALTGGAAGSSRTGPTAPNVATSAAPPTEPRHFPLRIAAVGLVLWAVPTVLAALALGASATMTVIGLFFSKLAVVTFGGAYAVLGYMAQEAVDAYGWLSAPEMLTGLGLAETTPGPLIMVVQFVGFLAAYRDPIVGQPMLSGVLGGLMATWVTFVPSFLFVLLGAPYVERLRDNRRLNGALATITAAVVGVILNLAVWFALHVVFTSVEERRWGIVRVFLPEMTSLDVIALALTAGSLLAMVRFRTGVLPTLGVCAAVGVVVSFIR